MIDVVVAGGGPVGLVTALHAARCGLRTVVVEPRPTPIDKACGEGLMPGAVRALAEVGVRPAGRPFRGIRYVDGGRSGVADFPDGPGLGVRRTVLHAALHDAAVAAGVGFRTARVGEVEQTADAVCVAGLQARYLVAADGLHSAVRRAVGLDRPAGAGPARWGVRAHYAVPPWSHRVEVHWAADAEAYVTPVAADLVGVAVLGSQRAPLADRLAAFPGLLDRLPDRPVAHPRAAGPLRQRVRGCVAGRVLLVGDAAGYVDALTGEGLATGFACAAAAVRRVAAGDAAGYARDHARLTRRYRAITGGLLWAGGRPLLRRHLVQAAAAQPWLFRRAVAALSG